MAQNVYHSESEKVHQEGCPEPPPSRALTPEDSDFFPSISLAAALLLIFISVLPLLSQNGTAFVPLRKLGNFSRKEVHFHPLLYIQPRSTQLTLETLAKSQEETIIVLAVAKEDAVQTLVCFSKNVVALLSRQSQGHPVIRQVTKVQTLRDTLGVFSISVITQRKEQLPHCTILRPVSPVFGNVYQMEITPQEEEVTMRTDSPTIAQELLELVYKTGQVPETFEVKGNHVKVIHILGDPYLESGIVC